MNHHNHFRKKAKVVLTIVALLFSACQSISPASTPITTAVPPSAKEGTNTGIRGPGKSGTSTPLIGMKDLQWEKRVDTNMTWYVERAPLAGAVIAIRINDEARFMNAYGLENVSPSTQAKTSTVYEIGAITLQFTAAAILLLADKHSLRLDDPVTQHLPALPPILDGIQIRHLLNHTSGILDPEAYYSLFDDQQEYTPQEILEKTLSELKTNAEPGTTWAYSYYEYFLLGMIIEAVSGQTYADFLAENIFLPAGMHSTRLCLDPGPPTAKNYVYEPRTFQPVEFNMSVAYSAVGLCSTAEDLLAWQEALVRGEIISPESYQEMMMPLSPGQIKDKENYIPYGYGVIIDEDHGKKYIYHGSYINGNESYLLYYPDYDLTVVMLSNTSIVGTNVFEFLRSNIVSVLFSN